MNEINDSCSSPFFSVVITTFNRGHLIEKAIASLLRQTYTNWEGIIIDDGSTDDTKNRLKPYLENCEKLSYHFQQNIGAATAKNSGIDIACGQYITFLDSDDAYRPDHLQSRYDLLKANPGVPFLHGGIKIIGNPFVPDRFNSKEKIHLSQCIIGGTFFVHQEIARRLHGFQDIPIGSDADFFDRVIEAGISTKMVTVPSYYYYRNCPDSVTNQS